MAYITDNKTTLIPSVVQPVSNMTTLEAATFSLELAIRMSAGLDVEQAKRIKIFSDYAIYTQSFDIAVLYMGASETHCLHVFNIKEDENYQAVLRSLPLEEIVAKVKLLKNER